MKTYELTYIFSPEITSEEALAAAKEIESFIQSKDGSVLKQTNPTAKTLSYPIKSHSSGFIGALVFQAEQEIIKELKERMEKDVKIIRSMVIIKKPVKERKVRRTRIKESPSSEKPEINIKTEEEPSTTKASDVKQKVELKDIEQKLDEILGE